MNKLIAPLVSAAICWAVLPACQTQPPQPAAAAPDPKAREIARIQKALATHTGDGARGRGVFSARCAACHSLDGAGGKLGPDLTHYARDRQSLPFLIGVIGDPQHEVHDYHTSFEVTTTDGRKLTGVILEQGSDAMVLVDATGRQVKLPSSQVRSRRPLMSSMMPETVLSGLNDQQIADLFAYLVNK